MRKYFCLLLLISIYGRAYSQDSLIYGGWKFDGDKSLKSPVNDCFSNYIDSIQFCAENKFYSIRNINVTVISDDLTKSYYTEKSIIYGYWNFSKNKKKIKLSIISKITIANSNIRKKCIEKEYIFYIDSMFEKVMYFQTKSCRHQRQSLYRKIELPNFNDTWVKYNNKYNEKFMKKVDSSDISKNIYLAHPRNKNKTKLIPGNYVTIDLESPNDVYKFEYYTGKIIDFTDDTIFLKLNYEYLSDIDSTKYSYNNKGGPIKKIPRSSINKIFFDKPASLTFLKLGSILTGTGLANSFIFAQFLSINFRKQTFNKALWQKLQLASVPTLALGITSFILGNRYIYIAKTDTDQRRREWILKKSN